MKTKPFDLERALAGDPVVTATGDSVTAIAYSEHVENEYKVCAVAYGVWRPFTVDGRANINWPSPLYDLLMLVKTITVNGFEVPEPVREPLERFDLFYTPSVDGRAFSAAYQWTGGKHCMKLLNHGIIHLTEESAIIHAKAMLGIDPYKEESV